MRDKRRAFTLIELLVVIAIISVLAAILFPVFAQAKNAAKQIVCVSNLKQLGSAFLMYFADNDELAPNTTDGTNGEAIRGGWVFYKKMEGPFDVGSGSLYPYVTAKDVYFCPMDGSGKSAGLSYAINSCLTNMRQTTPGFSIGLPIGQFEEPSSTLLLGEETVNGLFSSGSTNDGYLNYYVDHYSSRHVGGGVVGFLDGHVKRFAVERIHALQTGGQAECPAR